MKRLQLMRKWLPVALAVGVVILSAGAYALLRAPSWYEIPVVEPQDRQAVRNNLVGAEQSFTEALRADGGPFVYHVFQDDVNRWIAMRREIYPLIDELTPPELADPIVLFDTAEITVAGRYKKSGLSVVLSIDIAVAFEQDEIILRAAALRCGSVRVPIDFVSLGLNRPIDHPAGTLWPGSPRMSGDFLTGFHIQARAWWKNGGYDYRVLGVIVEPGKLNLKIEPLGRHPSKAAKHQD